MRVTVTEIAGPPKRRLLKDKEGDRRLSVSIQVWMEVMAGDESLPTDMEPSTWRLLELAEIEALLAQARVYLAGAERSPLAFSRWLERRRLTPDVMDRLTKSMMEENLLSPARYAAEALSRAEARGHQPLWLVKKKIQAHQVPRSIVDPLSYDEAAALHRHLRKRRLLGKDEKLLTKKLLARGFSIQSIREALKGTGEEN